MTCYLHTCKHCGEMELERSMKDPSPKVCPECGSMDFEQVFCAHFHAPADMFQENKNKGLGMYYPELGPRFLDAHTRQKPNPAAYARSQNEAIEKFRRKGATVEKC